MMTGEAISSLNSNVFLSSFCYFSPPPPAPRIDLYFLEIIMRSSKVLSAMENKYIHKPLGCGVIKTSLYCSCIFVSIEKLLNLFSTSHLSIFF